MTAGDLKSSGAERIFLSLHGAVTAQGDVSPQPMYRDLNEVLDMIRTLIEERTPGRVDSCRTVESGAIEEYVLVERGAVGQRLLLRVWPFFFPYQKRLEYRLYIEDHEVREAILGYLGTCASANHASLVPKG